MEEHFDAFHALAQEKKERIINAALEEIARKGFKKASTNAIVENAGISKGTLFYYFGSKEELFDFLCDYTIEFARQEYAAKFEHQAQTRDFIERLRVLSEVKRWAVSSHPKIIKFFESFYYPENAAHFSKYNDAITEIRGHIMGSLYENIDYSLFRDDIEPEKTLTYIGWLIERYEKDLMDEFYASSGSFSENAAMMMGKEPEELFNKFNAFLADLRKAFYK